MMRRVIVVLAAAVVLLGGSRGRADGPDAELIYNAALGHLKEGRAESAVEEFQRALRIEPKNPFFHKGIGVAYLALKRLPEAIASFRKALELNPYYVDARNDLGTALILSGAREEGKRELLAAYNEPMNPTPELTSRNLGRAYFDDGDLEQALTWFRTSVRRNPRYVDAHLGLADTLIGLNRVDEAIRHLESAVNTTSDRVDMVFALGRAYYRAGRWDEARRRLEQVVQKDGASANGRKAADLLKNLPK